MDLKRFITSRVHFKNNFLLVVAEKLKFPWKLSNVHLQGRKCNMCFLILSQHQSDYFSIPNHCCYCTISCSEEWELTRPLFQYRTNMIDAFFCCRGLFFFKVYFHQKNWEKRGKTVSKLSQKHSSQYIAIYWDFSAP